MAWDFSTDPEFQEQLDTQLKEYAGLYELNKMLNSVFELPDVFAYAGAYAINNLGYERVLFFHQTDTTASYAVCAADGYYEQQEKNDGQPRLGRAPDGSPRA